MCSWCHSLRICVSFSPLLCFLCLLSAAATITTPKISRNKKASGSAYKWKLFYMINKTLKHLTRFCSEDISLIENYDKAIADQTQTWHCHHRAEILPCGNYSANDLKKFGLYYNRPACELIFLPPKMHVGLHGLNKNRKKESIQKLRLSVSTAMIGNNSFLGKSHTAKTKKTLSKQKIGLKHWNNGIIGIRARECPEGFKPGMLKTSKA